MAEKKSLPPGVVSSMDSLAAVLGVHRRTVCEWRHKDGFPTSNGNYNIIAVDRWRHGYSFIDEDNPSSLLNDMDNRTQALIESLRELQPELVQSLPENQQAAFAELLDEAIGNAVKDAFGEGDSSYFYEDFYKGEPQ